MGLFCLDAMPRCSSAPDDQPSLSHSLVVQLSTIMRGEQLSSRSDESSRVVKERSALESSSERILHNLNGGVKYSEGGTLQGKLHYSNKNDA